MNVVGIIVEIIGGLIGGAAGGKVIKDSDLGTVANLIVAERARSAGAPICKIESCAWLMRSISPKIRCEFCARASSRRASI